MQLLQQNEHVSTSLAQGIAAVLRDGPCSPLIIKIMKEMGNMDMEELAKEGGTAKAYSTFLIALSELSPQHIIEHIAPLMNHLNGEVLYWISSVIDYRLLIISNLSVVLDEECSAECHD